MMYFILFCVLVTSVQNTSADFAAARRRQSASPTAVSPGPVDSGGHWASPPSPKWVSQLTTTDPAMGLLAAPEEMHVTTGVVGSATGDTAEETHDRGSPVDDTLQMSGDGNKDLDVLDHALATYSSSPHQSVTHGLGALHTSANPHLLPVEVALGSVTDETPAHSVDSVVMETWEQWRVVLNSSHSTPFADTLSKNESEDHAFSYTATGTGDEEGTVHVEVGAGEGAAEDPWLFDSSGDRLIPIESAAITRRPTDNLPEVQAVVTPANTVVITQSTHSTVTKLPKSHFISKSPATPRMTTRTPYSRKAMTKHQWHNRQGNVDAGQVHSSATPSLKFGGQNPGSFPGERSCIEGWGPCVASSNPNGTALEWDDLQHTLSFSWVLHVYGTAVLSLLLMGGALLCLLVHSCTLRGCLVLADAQLALMGGLQATHFLLDPYGTLNFLPRSVIRVFYNLPLPLLLWAQVALIAQVRRMLLPSALRHPLVAGAFAILHCTALLTADLLSPTLPHATPILLQALSLSWGLGLCLGLLFHMLPHQHSSLWNSTGAVHGHTGRTLVSSALQGTLCCALQVHSAFWLYGLLGNWRRFSWTWWLVQIWARLLELVWGWTLLLLACQGPREELHAEVVSSPWATLIPRLPKHSGRTPERFWADLLPSKWAEHLLKNQSHRENPEVKISVTCEQNTPPPATINMEDVSGEFTNEDKKACIDTKSFGSCLELQIEGQECNLPNSVEFMHPPYPAEITQALSIQPVLKEASYPLPSCSTTTDSSSTPQNDMAGTQLLDITVENLNSAIATTAHLHYRCPADQAIRPGETGEGASGLSAAGRCLQHSELQRDSLSQGDDDITHL